MLSSTTNVALRIEETGCFVTLELEQDGKLVSVTLTSCRKRWFGRVQCTSRRIHYPMPTEVVRPEPVDDGD